MHDTTITVQGYAGGDVEVRTVGETRLATFRVAATPRRFDRKSGEWVDAPTQWYSVKAWRGLADNVAFSVRRGDAVIVHGRLVANTWVKDGVEMSSMEIDATVVGHDLNRGTTRLVRPQRPAALLAELEAAVEQEPPAEQTETTIGSRGETAPEEWLSPKVAA